MFVAAMSSEAQLDHDHLWHPFTQQRDWVAEEPLMIERGEGTELIDAEGGATSTASPRCGATSTAIATRVIDQAVREQLDRVAHSTMLGLSHPGAAELAARLVEIAPPGLSRVFYSDSGSTAVEVALKMAFQYWQHRGGQHVRRTSFICLEDAYHGDTIGSVSVGGIDLFHSTFGPLLFESHRASPGDVADMAGLLAAARGGGRRGDRRAAGPGRGRDARPPARLPARGARALRPPRVLLICDEVATGFGRTGTMFACEQEGVAPDLLCLAKGLTGGYMPLAATLATERIYEAFLGAHEEFKTFFHGHTYTGNPLACAAALARSTSSSRSGPWCGCSRRSGCWRSCSRPSRADARGARGPPARLHGRHRPRRARSGARGSATGSRSRRASAG